MTDPTPMMHAAALWFADALKAHVSEHPDQCGEWLQMFEAGTARASVVIEIVPNPTIRCGFELDDKIVAFHTANLTDRPWPLNG